MTKNQFNIKVLAKNILLIFILIILFLFTFKFVTNYIYPLKYKDLVINYAEKNNLDPFLLSAIIKTESNFDENATSQKNAKGLMQLTDSTAIWCGEKMNIEINDLYNPALNLETGAWYYKYLYDKFNSNTLALAAYNGGVSNVSKWISEGLISENNIENIPFQETKNFVKRVNTYEKVYRFLYKDELNNKK